MSLVASVGLAGAGGCGVGVGEDSECGLEDCCRPTPPLSVLTVNAAPLASVAEAGATGVRAEEEEADAAGAGEESDQLIPVMGGLRLQAALYELYLRCSQQVRQCELVESKLLTKHIG